MPARVATSVCARVSAALPRAPAYALIAALAGCAAQLGPAPAGSAPPAPEARRPDDCPRAPRLEWYLLRDGEGVPRDDSPFGLAGHVLRLALDDAPEAPSLVGALDVKGTETLARVTRALAMAAYRRRVDADHAPRLAVSLDGRVLAALPVVTTLHGPSVRVPLVDPASLRDEPVGRLDRDLREAALVDRVCFAAREVPTPSWP